MNVELKELEGNYVEFTVAVSEEQFTQALDKAFVKVSKDVSLPGFRKGKVPRPVFEKKYGVQSLYNEALDALIPDIYAETLQLHPEVKPVAYPKVDLEAFNPEEGKIVVKIKVAVKPEVILGDYKKINIPTTEVIVTKEDITAEVESLLQRFAEMEIIDGPAAMQDTVVIDFEGFKDGVAFDGGKGENYPLKLGSNSFIPGFEEQLVNKNSGDEVEINVSFPENYHVDTLAGQPVIFKVKIHEIKRDVIPELTEEIIQKLEISDVATVEALHQHLETKISSQKTTAADNERRTAAIAEAVNQSKVEIPQEMIDLQVERMVENFENQLQMQGMKLDQYLQMTGMELSKLKEQMVPDALKQIKETLVLEKIAETEQIEIKDIDIDNKIVEMAKIYQMEVAKIRELLPDTSGIKNEIKIEKVIELLTKKG